MMLGAGVIDVTDSSPLPPSESIGSSTSPLAWVLSWPFEPPAWRRRLVCVAILGGVLASAIIFPVLYKREQDQWKRLRHRDCEAVVARLEDSFNYDRKVPGKHVVVDEMMTPCRNKMNPLRVYNKSKPHKFGIQEWSLNDAVTSYQYAFNVDPAAVCGLRPQAELQGALPLFAPPFGCPKDPGQDGGQFKWPQPQGQQREDREDEAEEGSQLRSGSD